MSEKMKKMEARFEELSNQMNDVSEDLDELKSKEEIIQAKLEQLCCINIAATVTVAISLVLLLISLFFVAEVQDSIETVTEQITAYKEAVDTAPETGNANSDATAIFADSVLPMGNRKLYDENGNTFYSDPDCTYAITNPEFSTWSSMCGKDSKGTTVRILRLTDGDFAYIQANYNVDLVSR